MTWVSYNANDNVTVQGIKTEQPKGAQHVIEIPVYQGRVKKQEQNQMTNIIVH